MVLVGWGLECGGVFESDGKCKFTALLDAFNGVSVFGVGCGTNGGTNGLVVVENGPTQTNTHSLEAIRFYGETGCPIAFLPRHPA